MGAMLGRVVGMKVNGVAFLFFFQAEDGIRDYKVTGVQTCALPILHRDVEYAQQRVRLRLLERQEQLMRMARDIGNHDLGESDFASRAEALISQYPELQSITWIDAQRRILASQSAPTVSSEQLRIPREVLRAGDALEAYQLAREMQQPIYVQGLAHKGEAAPLLQLHVPLAQDGRYIGELLGEYSIDSLLRYGTPTEIMARYAMTMLDSRGQVLAGTPLTPRKQTATELLRWRTVANEDEAPVAPVGNSLEIGRAHV